MEDRRADLARFDNFRRAVVCEPRGHEAVVGALLTPPVERRLRRGRRLLRQRGRTSGCAVTARSASSARWSTSAASGPAPSRSTLPREPSARELDPDGAVTIENVARAIVHARGRGGRSPGRRPRGGRRRVRRQLVLPHRADAPALELVERRGADARDARRSRACARRASPAPDGAEIDHVEIFGPRPAADADARNFVLCPGARLRPLAVRHRDVGQDGGPARAREAAAGRDVAAGEHHGQPLRAAGYGRGGELIPHIRGRAYITGDSTLYFDPATRSAAGFAPSR